MMRRRNIRNALRLWYDHYIEAVLELTARGTRTRCQKSKDEPRRLA
jgi:hypothetical protein